MPFDTERTELDEAEREATADGGLCRLDLPGSELREDDELADNDSDAG
jgi:hypothetical protein